MNPDPAVAEAFSGQWHKLLMILMHKQGLKHIVLSAEDVFAATASHEGQNMVVQELEDGIHLRVVSDPEVKQILRGTKNHGH